MQNHNPVGIAQQPTQPVIFHQYSTNVGYFVKCNAPHYYHANNYILNTIEPSKHVVLNGYVRLSKGLQSVKKLVKGSRNLVHYKLKDEELSSEKFPLITVQYWDDDTEENRLKGVEGYEALYEPVYNQQEDQIVDVPFEVVNLGTFEIEDPSSIKNRKIKSQVEGNWGNKVIEQELSQVVIYDDIVKLLTPEFALTQSPCKLSSKQMFSIVRQHLKENLDMKENSITLDFDFCFTVKKRVHTKPFLATESYYRGKKLKSKSVTKNEKFVEVFEMSWSGYKGTGGYNDYTCIPELKGDNLQDLSDKLDEYLYGLTTALNKRVEECTCCNGTGHIVEKFNHE